MNRRAGWVIGSIVAALALAGAALWIWQASSTPSAEPSPPAATATSTPEADTRTLAQEQLDAHLERCAEQQPVGGAVPEGCGIRIPWGTEFAAVDSIRFRVEKLPALVLADDGTYMAQDGILVATVSGTGQDASPRTETYRTESWAVRGEVSDTGSGVEITVW